MIQFQPPGIRDERDKTGKCLTPVRFRFPCPAASEITFFTFMNAQDELKIRDMEILFQPFHSRKLSTPTHIVLPAMTRGFFSQRGSHGPGSRLLQKAGQT